MASEFQLVARGNTTIIGNVHLPEGVHTEKRTVLKLSLLYKPNLHITCYFTTSPGNKNHCGQTAHLGGVNEP